MKAGELTDATIEESGNPVVIKMPDGTQITTSGYGFGSDKGGNPVLVIYAGKKKGSRR